MNNESPILKMMFSGRKKEILTKGFLSWLPGSVQSMIKTIVLLMIPSLIWAQSPRTTVLLKNDWKFHKGASPNAEQINFDDSDWQTVNIPHDWAIYGPFDKEIDKQEVAILQNGEEMATEKTGRTGALPYTGIGWYRKSFELPEFDKNKQALLVFEGAMSEPQVFLNGQKVGEWKYGYSYFYFDVSEVLKEGEENQLSVRLQNRERSSRWYPGAGLYRKVYLIIKEKEHFEQWGTFITTPEITDTKATVHIESEYMGNTPLAVWTTVLNSKGDTVIYATQNIKTENKFELDLTIENPKLWSPETPHLYQAILQLYKGPYLKDQIEITFGIRDIEYIPEKGFFLNGKNRKFKGVCLHHDLGPLGAAINKAALKRQLEILKEMGADAVRSSHNMPSIEQLELCDEIGLLFLAESFDEWAKPKVDSGYHLFFDEYAEKDIVNLVRATRNHPSIVMWSAGNEVPDQWGVEGVERAKFLQDVFHREDPTRPVTVGMDQVKATMESGFGAVLDIPGLNYRVHLYEEAFKTFPQGFILGSETASTVSSRGVYKFPVEKASMKKYPDYQSSSYDMEYCSWSNLPETDFEMQDDKPWVIGEFVWTGFDYLGEPTPYDEVWPSRSSYFGICDLAGLPKDRYYLYRCRWNKEEETLHILPHWNWEGREGQVTPVFVYTSYNRAELFINGKSQGIQEKSRESLQHRYRLMWMDTKYEPGELKVIAYDDHGNPAMEEKAYTSGTPHQIVLEADKTQLIADGEDMVFVTVSVVDENGIPCPTASNQLEFEVSGAADYRAACNGDATSLEMFHEPTMKLFSGKLVVYLLSNGEIGEVELKVSGEGLQTSILKLSTK